MIEATNNIMQLFRQGVIFNISLVLISILRSTINAILSKYCSLPKVWSLSICIVSLDKSVISTAPNYLNNNEIICYRYNKPISILYSILIVTDMNIDSNNPDF